MTRVDKSKRKSFAKDTNGNFSTLGIIGFLAVMLTSALSVDYMALSQAATELESIIDGAALASGRTSDLTIEERRAIAQETIGVLSRKENKLTNIEHELTADTTDSAILITVKGRAKARLLFGEFWKRSAYVNHISEVTVDIRSVEIALVLDISASMTNSRLDALKSASTDLVSALLDEDLRIGTVNISLVPFGGTVRLPQELDNFVIEPDNKDFLIGGEWNGCVYMEPADYQNGINRFAEFTYLPDFYRFVNLNLGERNNLCPLPGNELVGLSQNKQKLLDTIQSFSRSDYTGTGSAVAWGLATLNPDWKNIFPNVAPELPSAKLPNHRKVMVLMSDGGVSQVDYPLDNRFPSNAANHPINSNAPFRLHGGSSNTRFTVIENENALQILCDHVISEGVEIYTVGFELRSDRPEDEQSLRNCASSQSHFYESGISNLTQTFFEIASELAGRRISK